MVMHAGQYRTRLVMYQDTASTPGGDQAADGFLAPEWAEIARPWCRVRPMDGKEVIEYAALLDSQPVVVECRYDKRFAGVNPTGWRLTNLDGTAAYDILAASNIMMRNEQWRFLCRTGSMVPT
tara:strand:+ start:5575 stop:5943 length:369 start_codon:yes stop_codon:yes gene_type:complete